MQTNEKIRVKICAEKVETFKQFSLKECSNQMEKNYRDFKIQQAQYERKIKKVIFWLFS